MARVALLCALVGGCTDDERELGKLLEVTIHSDEPLDQIVVRRGYRSCPSCEGPITPRMLAAGVTTPPFGSVFESKDRVEMFDPPATEHLYKEYSHVGIDSGDLLILGYQRDAAGNPALLSAGTVHVQYEPVGVIHKSVELTRATLDGLEIWGTSGHCAAELSGKLPRFFVDWRDTDCDGLSEDDDCNPGVYCDPDATAPAARAACQSTTCEPCIGKLDGACVLGTATVCGLPVAPATGSSRVCPGGSAFEVALPHTACAHAEMLQGYTTGAVWAASITPSCVLRIELVSGSSVYDRAAIVTFETGSTTASVALHVELRDGMCGAVGTCEPVPASATCGL